MVAGHVLICSDVGRCKWSFRPVLPRLHPRYKGSVLLVNYGSENKWRSAAGMLRALSFTKAVRR